MVESITCQNCQQSFVVTTTDEAFYLKVGVPAPTFCPQCRLQRRLAWRNEHNLYQRNCDLCKKTIISIYRPDSPYTVYCQECWWSDQWDPTSFGRDYDWTKDFFTQYDSLRRVVPRVALTNTNSENSEYTNYAGNNKNCYLMFANALGDNENCAYGVGSGKCHDCYDTLNVYDSELSYDCADSKQLHRVVGAVNCQTCTESWYLEDCSNCQHCIGCKGLRNKQYCVFNEQYSAEDYAKRVETLQLNTPVGLQTLQHQWEQFRLTVPSRYSHQLKSEQCTGDYITNSTQCDTCFDVNETEQSKYIKFSIGQLKDSYDVSYTGTSELGYEDLSLVDANNCRFCNITWWSVCDLEYCELCFNTASCFASISLRKQQYCILNKPYSEIDYKNMIKKIKQHMNDQLYTDAGGRVYRYGEFPPPEQSPFAYVESVAEDFFPSQSFSINQFPVTTSTSLEVRPCVQCQKSFKLIPAELVFYTTMGLPTPQYCFNCRHQTRLRHKNAVQLWQRQCMQAGCTNQFQTTYAPNRPELVYCERCYNRHIY